MLDLRTLRGRLTFAYASALFLGLVLFAGLTLALLDRIQRYALDQQLSTAARAVAAIVNASHDSLELDAADSAQFAQILGNRVSGAVFARGGRLVASSAVVIPVWIRDYGARATQYRIDTIGPREGEVRIAALPLPVEVPGLGVVLIWRSVESIEDLDRRAGIAFALLIPVIVLLGVAFGGVVAERGLRPLQRIALLASEIEGHDLSRRLRIPEEGGELSELGATFDRMLDRLEAAFDRQRQFTADASHEIRAPLSIIRAEADLALRRERDPAEYRRALTVVAQEADHLERLTRDLLEAARADASGVAAPTVVDLAEIAAHAVDRLEVLARTKGVEIRRDFERALVCGDPAALQSVAVAVVHNALKYTPAGGHVEVGVGAHDGSAHLCVRDDGPGFTTDALEHAFDRFWRAEAARGRDGAGLGLSIAQTIVAGAGGSIVLANRAEGGAQVDVALPLVAS